MTPQSFTTYVRLRTRTNSNTFSDADILALMAVTQEQIARKILKADEDILLVPQYTNLIADQRQYKLPSDIITRIKRVEAKLDGSKYIKLSELDINLVDYPITNESDITTKFTNDEGIAKFDIMRKSLVIYSGTITNVSAGLRVWCDTYPTAITNLALTTDLSEDPSSTTHGIPVALHELWARGVIIKYKESREKPIPLSESESMYDQDIDKVIQDLRNANADREIQFDLPNAYTRGDEGYDY